MSFTVVLVRFVSSAAHEWSEREVQVCRTKQAKLRRDPHSLAHMSKSKGERTTRAGHELKVRREGEERKQQTQRPTPSERHDRFDDTQTWKHPSRRAKHRRNKYRVEQELAPAGSEEAPPCGPVLVEMGVVGSCGGCAKLAL
jgi:hypothetical protein